MMNILLDTCTFLWIISGDEKLSEHARSVFSQQQNIVYLSAASVWEITVKYGLHKLPLPENPFSYIPKQREAHKVEKLPITEEASLCLAKLPSIHKDPFDRILICQSIVTGCLLLTPDPLIRQYPVNVLWE